MLWDADGEGSLSPDEMISAFVRIGLSSDHMFAKQIMNSIRPSRGGSADSEIKLKDFVKIFKEDKQMDYMISKINAEVKENLLKTQLGSKPTNHLFKQTTTQFLDEKSTSTEPQSILKQKSVSTNKGNFDSQLTRLEETTVKKEEPPTFGEQIKIIEKWWGCIQEIEGASPDTKELPVNAIIEFLTKQRLVPDHPQAIKLIEDNIGSIKALPNPGKIAQDEFCKLFCKGMFKMALINTIDKLQANQNQEMPLSLKIQKYQREKLLVGLNPHDNSVQK
jgi:hypothetical protein